MKILTHFLRATMVGGIFFLFPIVMLAIVLTKAIDYANKVLQAKPQTAPPIGRDTA